MTLSPTDSQHLKEIRLRAASDDVLSYEDAVWLFLLVDRLTEKLAKSRADLDRYGDHIPSCVVFVTADGCTCGYDAAIEDEEPTP